MKDTLKTVFDILDNKKAMDIRILDVSKVCSFTDYFVICSGANEKHIQTLAEELEEKLKKQAGLRPSHVEGAGNAEWVLMDYFDLVVHIMSLEAREFYELDRLWADGVALEIPNPK
ncbi:MAG: ribosome silencing factor [Acidobacteria bacterium]|nr:ribosome silencing factor [Acidobacteriota bacterium]